MTRAARPLGTVTRGTTRPNRLRRVDRWIVHRAGSILRSTSTPLVVDLGYGAEAWTPRDLRDAVGAGNVIGRKNLRGPSEPIVFE